MANLFSNGAPQFFPTSAAILLLVWSANGDFTASSKVNLLNDDTYRCDSATIIMSSFGEREQGAHKIRKSLIYSTRKVFLERVVVKLVYKFNEKSKRVFEI